MGVSDMFSYTIFWEHLKLSLLKYVELKLTLLQIHFQ